MNFFREHKLKGFGKYFVSHKDVYSALTAQTLETTVGAVVFALMPVILAFYLGNEQIAGIVIALFTALQIFVFIPLSGVVIDKKGALLAMKLGVFAEIIGILLWVLVDLNWGIYFFFLGYFFRWSFFLIDPFLLRRTESEEGGFWFGLKEEIIAIGNFLGILVFTWFVAREHWYFLPFVSALTHIISLSFLYTVEVKGKKRKITWKALCQAFNYWHFIKSGLSFIHKNHRYPLFNLGSNLFEGLFYGSIWFLLPLHLAKMAVEGDSLSLGIYEVVTIAFALICGVLADRLDWRKQELFSWLIMIVMVWILPFWHSQFALVVIGFVIGLANNFFASAGYHVLALFDEDHEEDGQYVAFAKIVCNSGYMVSPIICGYLYYNFGFDLALVFVAVVVTLIALWMLFLTKKLGRI